MNKHDVKSWLRWIRRSIPSLKVRPVIKTMAHAEGTAHDTGYVQLHPQGQILTTFVHECIHVRYPKLEENTVLEWEKDIMDGLTDRQAANLLVLLGNTIAFWQGKE